MTFRYTTKPDASHHRRLVARFRRDPSGDYCGFDANGEITTWSLFTPSTETNPCDT